MVPGDEPRPWGRGGDGVGPPGGVVVTWVRPATAIARPPTEGCISEVDETVRSQGDSMKRVIVLFAVLLVLFGTMLPSAAWAGGRGYGGYWGGHGGWWWPGAVIGGLALGAAAILTAPLWALPPAPAYAPPVVYAPPPAYSVPPMYAPPPTYAAPSPTYQPVPSYAPPQVVRLQREVVYPNGRYVLYGDGVRQPWQWVWVPSASPPPPPPPPQ